MTTQKLTGQALLDVFDNLRESYGYDAPLHAGYVKEDGSPDSLAFFNAKVQAVREVSGEHH